MGLKLHNTLTRTKQDFVPIDPDNVRMYVCGPTVYDFAHIGNARPLIVFDVLYRLLRHLYGPDHVTYVRNITDVDDKINARAAEEYPELLLNEAIREVTTRTTEQFHADVKALGCLPPTVEPRATEYIAEMTAMIATLVDKGFAYVAEGHVLFHVAAMKDYGRLSNRTLDDMIAGARVEVAPYKKDPTDFVLWKPSKAGEPAWDSPWGSGRPGWHLECSAMAGKLLGDTFDIHGGGIDLVFPHHENEIAQSRCAHGTDVMANYWLHNGFLQVEGEKMSKSLGNFVTIRDLLNDWPGEVVRLAMLMTHYRQPLDFTMSRLKEAERRLHWWYQMIELVPAAVPSPNFLEVLKDDLNTVGALSFLTDEQKRHREWSDEEASVFKANANVLGLLQLNNIEWANLGHERLLDMHIEASVDGIYIDSRIRARAAARAAKDWAEADRIRDELDVMGVALKDAKDPETDEIKTSWEVKR